MVTKWVKCEKRFSRQFLLQVPIKATTTLNTKKNASTVHFYYLYFNIKITPTSFSWNMVRSMSPTSGGERAVASKAFGPPISSFFIFKTVVPNGQRWREDNVIVTCPPWEVWQSVLWKKSSSLQISKTWN